MAEQPLPQRQTSFQEAIDGITDGFSKLVRKHFELARTEVRREASEVGQYVGALAAFAAIAIIGYAMLNVAIVLFAAWLGGLGPMTLTALGLAIVNLGVAAIAIVRILGKLQQSDVGLSQTTEELQRDKQWLKEIRANSPADRLTDKP